MRYGKHLHKKAFILWANGFSLKRMAKLPGMPTERQLREWKKPNYPCDCGWHGWEELVSQMASKKIPEDEKQEVLKWAESNLPPDHVEKALKWASSIDWEKLREATDDIKIQLREVVDELAGAVGISPPDDPLELTGNLQFDILVTAYLLLLKVREATVVMKMKDPYQVINALSRINAMMRDWKLPQMKVEVDEVEEVEVQLIKPELITREKLEENG